VVPAHNFPPAVLRQTLAALRVNLEPAGRPQIASELARLEALTRSREAGELDWKLRAMEYHRLLGHYPADIWRDAVDEWLQNPESGKWLPTIAELTGLMGARLFERKLMIDRIERMLAPPPPKQNEPREPLDVRLRTIRDAFRGSKLFHARAVKAERELAELEGRAVEPWATEAA